jgi:hypothetical protein
MRRKEWLVFDEFIPDQGPVFTSDELARQLGRYDLLSIIATVDQQNAAGTLTIQIC